MPDPTALEQYVINNSPSGPGDITHVTVTNPGWYGLGVLHYYTVGKLCFGFYFVGAGGVNAVFGSRNGSGDPTGDTELTADYIAAQLGLPAINTYYIGSEYFNGGGYVSDHSTGAWINGGGGINGGFLMGFLVN